MQHKSRFSFYFRFNDVNQRGHIVGSWLEDGSWGLGVFAPDSSKFRVPTALQYCVTHVLLFDLYVHITHMLHYVQLMPLVYYVLYAGPQRGVEHLLPNAAHDLY